MNYSNRKKIILLLNEGSVFEGKPNVIEGAAVGKTCLNTGMTGCQEIFTAPSNFGQLIEHLGNYGVNKNDFSTNILKRISYFSLSFFLTLIFLNMIIMKKQFKNLSIKTLIIISFLLSFFLISSQELASQSTVGTVTSMNDLFTKHLKVSGKEEVSGNPFLFQNWENSGVVYSEGNTHSLKKLNYNILYDKVVSLKGKDSVLTYDKVKIDSFLINKKIFKKYYKSFYEVLYNSSKISLLKKYEVNIVEGMFNPIDGTKEKSRFKTTDDFYLKKGNDIVKFIPSKKTISSVFDEHSGLVKKFIKQNKLSLKKEKDLIQIFEYYNQL